MSYHVLRSVTAAIAGVLALSAALPALADAPPVAEQTIDALNKVWGVHPGMRANHAKGIVVEGSFKPSTAGPMISKATVFAGKRVPVTVRFSDSSGLPDLPDGSGFANPHGMAIKFHLPDGSELDIVDNALKFFPVATGEDFLALLGAIAESGPTAPKPTKLDAFFASHPAAPKALGSVQTPTSFAREIYNGIDAFVFVDAKGKRQPFRFKIVPAAGTQYLTPADAAKQPPDFLVTELPDRLAKGPVTFQLTAILAKAGDPTNDATQPWPLKRKSVDLGTLTLTKPVADNDAAQKALLFLPGNLIAGIEPSDDPLIDARNQAYAVSYGRRTQ